MFKVTIIAAIACLAFLPSCSSDAAVDSENSLDKKVQDDGTMNGQAPEQMSKEEKAEPKIVQTDWTDIEKMQLLEDFQTGTRSFDFYANFTEPFWTFYFFGNQVLFESMGAVVPQIVPLEYPFSDKSEEQTLRFMLNGDFWELKVIKGEGSDGMSELTYPYVVKGDLMEGGGSTSYVR